MKLEVDDKTNPEVITWKFTATKDEMAKCEFSQSTIKFIAELENSPGIADQLEVLLEYFHAIEGSNRITDLARYMRYLQEVATFKMPGNPINSAYFVGMQTSTSAQPMYSTLPKTQQKSQTSPPVSKKTKSIINIYNNFFKTKP